MKETDKKYWFPAKRYGWGWGPPQCWQGWTVFVIWLACFITGSFLLSKHLGVFLGFTTVLTAILVVICLVKGEPPRWRWGDDK